MFWDARHDEEEAVAVIFDGEIKPWKRFLEIRSELLDAAPFWSHKVLGHTRETWKFKGSQPGDWDYGRHWDNRMVGKDGKLVHEHFGDVVLV